MIRRNKASRPSLIPPPPPRLPPAQPCREEVEQISPQSPGEEPSVRQTCWPPPEPSRRAYLRRDLRHVHEQSQLPAVSRGRQGQHIVKCLPAAGAELGQAPSGSSRGAGGTLTREAIGLRRGQGKTVDSRKQRLPHGGGGGGEGSGREGGWGFPHPPQP